MTTITEHLKAKYNLSNYQIAQLTFLMKTIFSEISKMLIMGFLFYPHFTLYLFALLVMLCLRCTSGGLHFYTYFGCLFASTIYLWFAIILLPNLILPIDIQLIMLLCSLTICYFCSPVTSKYRPEYPKYITQKCRTIVCIFIFIYTLILYIIPENNYFSVGFWVIILHSLQLLVAKIQKKGVCIN